MIFCNRRASPLRGKARDKLSDGAILHAPPVRMIKLMHEREIACGFPDENAGLA
jgi:hypothetical protein